MKRKLSLLLPSIALGFALDVLGLTTSSSHLINEAASQFIVPIKIDSSARARGLFRNEIWAIRVETVTCDGIQVRGKASGAVLDDSDFRTFFPSSDVVCYRLSRQRILSAISFNPGKGAYELQVYDIPLRVREFIVGYRVRYADGQLSELQTAKSVDSNWFGLHEKSDEPSPDNEYR